MTNAIEVHELRKAFGDVRALDGASLTVPAGSVYGLVGPNASGKTTLLSIVRGVVRPTSGEALVFGRPPLDDPAVKGRIALASGNPYFLKPESADGMARFYRSVLPIFDVDRYLELAPLFEVDRTRPLRKLSRGARAKAALLLALSCTPSSRPPTTCASWKACATTLRFWTGASCGTRLISTSPHQIS